MRQPHGRPRVSLLCDHAILHHVHRLCLAKDLQLCPTASICTTWFITSSDDYAEQVVGIWTGPSILPQCRSIGQSLWSCALINPCLSRKELFSEAKTIITQSQQTLINGVFKLPSRLTLSHFRRHCWPFSFLMAIHPVWSRRFINWFDSGNFVN